MVSIKIEIPDIRNVLKKIDEILLSQGLTRRTTIKGDTLQAVGEAGIGIFYINLEGRTTLNIEARNKQALDIISNLVSVGLVELENKIGTEKKEIWFCSVCNSPLEFLDEKKLWNELNVKIMVCTECNRLEFFRAHTPLD
ncbi:MAG: hypothetical protein PWQ67_2284 [Clostridia bacterium]|jgi:hypothetical protein|nr:hypothetical protein [Clostridia bacterium]MDN5323830.1 hypothetical protein [Clostridia bacterium]